MPRYAVDGIYLKKFSKIERRKKLVFLQILRYILLFGLPAVLVILSAAFAVSLKKLGSEDYLEKKSKKTVCAILIGITVLVIATVFTSELLYYIVLLIGLPTCAIIWFFISLGLYFDVPQGIDRSKEKKMLKISAVTAAAVVALVIIALVCFFDVLKNY